MNNAQQQPPSSSSSKSDTSLETRAFPFMKQMDPSTLKEITPFSILLVNFLEVLQIVTGSLIVHAIPLVGGDDAKSELESWKLGVKEDDDAHFGKKESLSGYMAFALGLFALEKSITNHLMSSDADAIKAIEQVTSNFHLHSDKIEPLRKLLKSKDITPSEKFDAFWTCLDMFYNDGKNYVMENARKNPGTVEALIADLSMLFIKLDILTKGALFLRIIPSSLDRNSNI